MSATEFMAQLQKDKEYQARKAAFDAELQERASVLRAAEQTRSPLIVQISENELGWYVISAEEFAAVFFEQLSAQPISVPEVPMPATRCVTRPALWAQISSAVPR